MSREQVIDKIADDRIRFVSGFRHDSADEDARTTVPLEIDDAMRFARAVNFGPAVGTTWPLVLGRHELKFLFEQRIAHDFVAQRSAPARDDLNDCLHC